MYKEKKAEIDSDKLGFAQEVLNLVGPDLKKVGLTLKGRIKQTQSTSRDN